MVLPLMLVLFFGMAEVTTAVSADRKLTLLSRSLADLTGRTPTMTDENLRDIFKAVTTIMYPFTTETVTMSIASIVVKEQGGALKGTVCWSAAKGKDAAGNDIAPPQENSEVPVPDGFRTAGTSYIVAIAEMRHKPTVGYVLTGELPLGETTPWPVRNVPEVTRATGGVTKRCL